MVLNTLAPEAFEETHWYDTPEGRTQRLDELNTTLRDATTIKQYMDAHENVVADWSTLHKHYRDDFQIREPFYDLMTFTKSRLDHYKSVVKLPHVARHVWIVTMDNTQLFAVDSEEEAIAAIKIDLEARIASQPGPTYRIWPNKYAITYHQITTPNLYELTH